MWHETGEGEATVEQSDGVPAGSGDPAPDAAARLTVWVSGRVQGVGFRWWTRCRALELGLAGSARNLDDGRVLVVAEGRRAACEELVTLLAEDPPREPPRGASRSWYRRPGRVNTVTHRWSAPEGLTGFVER